MRGGSGTTKQPHQKKGKTFSGCWTCRDRGVKCDERKSSCLRCEQSSLDCGGYGIRLVWEDARHLPKARRGVDRRSMLDGSEANVSVLDDSEIDDALSTLDKEQGESAVVYGPFSVFNAVARLPSQDDEKANMGIVGSKLSHNPKKSDVQLRQSKRVQYDFISPHLPFGYETELSSGDRFLMHGWINYTLPALLPVPQVQNDFLELFQRKAVFLAGAQQTSAVRAYIHGICGITAFNHYHRFPISKTFQIAANHYQSCLRFLRQSVEEELESQKAMVLSVILIVASVGVVLGDSGDWRVHLQGARNWVNRHGIKFWKEFGPDGSLIYQLFLFADSLGSYPLERGYKRRKLEPRSEQISQGPQPLPIAYPGETVASEIIPQQPDRDLSRAYDYEDFDTSPLASVFGVTESILRCISRIDAASFSSIPPTELELTRLELEILSNEPDSTDPYLRTLQNCYYYACLIHFKRSLRQQPTTSVYDLVEKCMEHFKMIEFFEDCYKKSAIQGVLNVTYPLWPIFVTACEVEKRKSRALILHWLKKGQSVGIGNTASAAKVLYEIWTRRDQSPGVDVHWHDVMLDLKLDVLLL